MNETKHILVVDDELEIGHMIDAFLTEEGYRVSVARDAARMREIMNQQPVALVILDLILPGENGLEIARVLRAESNIGIIMLTGHGAAVDCIVGLEMGADDYMIKPANLRELLARVRSVLRRKDAEGVKLSFGPKSVANRNLTGENAGYNGNEAADTDPSFGRLTRREREVLASLLGGHSNKEIARSIDVKEVTVAFHLRGVFKKLGVTNRTQAAAKALRVDWQQPDVA